MIRFSQPLLPSLPTFVDKLQKIWDTAQLTNGGEQLQQLEKRLKGTLGAGHLSLHSNGTVALLIGLRALRLSGEVITTPFTFPATTHSLEWAGLTPVFCDIGAESPCLDPSRVEAAITKKTSAILAVHAYGIPCDVEALEAIAKRHGLKLIFDAAHAFGTEVGGRPIGEFGDMSMYSLHATKLFHTAEGGALICKNEETHRQVRLMQNFGIEGEDVVSISGINGKMNEIQAALGLCVLDMVEPEREKRRQIRARYQTNLADIPGVSILQAPANVRSSFQYLAIRIAEDAPCSRDEVYASMRAAGILARRYFNPLCSSIECYRSLPSARPENLPNAVRMANEILCVPCHGSLTVDEVDQICEFVSCLEAAR